MVGGRVAMLDYEKMGLNIKLRRIECGITQYRLAMILGSITGTFMQCREWQVIAEPETVSCAAQNFKMHIG